MKTVSEYLESNGIPFRDVRGQAQMECPACHRNDGRFALRLDSGAYNCKHGSCGIKGSFVDFQKLLGDEPVLINGTASPSVAKVYRRPEIKIGPVAEPVKKYLESRGLYELFTDDFRLGSVGEDTIIFPYYKDGILYGAKYRSIGTKQFWSEPNCEPSLFGRDLVTDETLIICEGEIDAITMVSYSRQAVSVPGGAGALQWIDTEWEFLERFKEIYLCFDMDEPGRKAVLAIARRMGSGRCKDVRLPHKDVNECLMKGVTPEEMGRCFMDAKTIVFDIEETEGKRSIAREVRAWIEESVTGTFTSKQIADVLEIRKYEEQKRLSQTLSKMVEQKIIARHGNKDANFRKIDMSEELLDPLSADDVPVDIRLPLGLNDFITIYGGNIIVIAGETGSGKTALCLKIAELNKDRMKVNYMSSEMNATELRIRLKEFKFPLESWSCVKWQVRADHFPDKIDPDALNIIDYLDAGTGDGASAADMTSRIDLIYRAIKEPHRGVTVIAIQKMKGKEAGYGGEGTMFRSRLYLTIGATGVPRERVLTMTKTKNPGRNRIDGTGMTLKFLVQGGCQFKPVGNWENG